MPLGWNRMIETGFDWKSYQGDCPVGEHEIVLDQVVYAKGAIAVHLFYQTQDIVKHWSLVRRKWPYDTVLHEEFKDFAHIGDRWMIRVYPGFKGKHTWIGEAKRLAPSEREWVVSTTIQRHYKEKKKG